MISEHLQLHEKHELAINPSTPPAVLQELAKLLPCNVAENPALDLIALEDGNLEWVLETKYNAWESKIRVLFDAIHKIAYRRLIPLLMTTRVQIYHRRLNQRLANVHAAAPILNLLRNLRTTPDDLKRYADPNGTFRKLPVKHPSRSWQSIFLLYAVYNLFPELLATYSTPGRDYEYTWFPQRAFSVLPWLYSIDSNNPEAMNDKPYLINELGKDHGRTQRVLEYLQQHPDKYDFPTLPRIFNRGIKTTEQ